MRFTQAKFTLRPFLNLGQPSLTVVDVDWAMAELSWFPHESEAYAVFVFSIHFPPA